MRKSFRHPKLVGEQAECAFMSAALDCGFSVSKPFGDSLTYDVIVDSRPLVTGRGALSRVQVRSTGKIQGRKFSVKMFCRGRTRKLDCDDADFLAVLIAPYRLWYIIPIKAIVPRGCVCLFPQHPNSRGHFERYREAWHLLENNM